MTKIVHRTGFEFCRGGGEEGGGEKQSSEDRGKFCEALCAFCARMGYETALNQPIRSNANVRFAWV